ncbi:MAG: hypothetical protein K6B68_13310, partial [Eubacterium sp.]|nr:hypothetical protein [Eubacterium sp.]
MFDGLVDTIKGWVASFVEYTLWRIFYWVEIGCVRFVALVEDVIEIFTGEKTVKYEGSDMYLINVFFEHKSIRGIYGGMALIGIVFCFVFAIVSVIRRAVDLRDKQQGLTMGIILGNLLKSILIISSMNLIMLVAITTTNTLIQTVSWTIQNGEELADPEEITFTDEQYAAMGRIINTIGNYSLNPSYKSRYNLNACYNDIRVDLKYLGDQGVFNFHYVTKNKATGEEVETWQSLMEELATAYNYENEAPLDEYHDGRTSAILDAIEILQANPTMEVLKYYKREAVEIEKDTDVPMDRILFLIGTMGYTDGVAAARNPMFNKNPSFFDNVRLPFYMGEKGADIYNYDDVRKVFDPSPLSTNYILVWFSSIAILKEMLVLIVTCAVRIFNLLALYLAAPLAIAVMPLDDGGKFKQWITAFIVQLLTILGMVIAIRLFLMFIPIIWSPALKTSNYSILDVIIKMVIQYGSVLSVNKVNGIFTGILADNAGFQAITAGDVRSNVENSSAGRMLDSMSAGAQAEKGFNKGRGALGKGLGKVSTTAAYISDMAGITEGAYENSSKRKKEQERAEGDKNMRKDRKQKRETNALEKDLNHLKTTGSHLDGRTPKNEAQKKHEVSKMEKTLAHMKEGDSLKEASRKAKLDMIEDKKDLEMEGQLKAKELRNPPPKRSPGPQLNKNSSSNKPPTGAGGQQNNSHRQQPGSGPEGQHNDAHRQQPGSGPEGQHNDAHRQQPNSGTGAHTNNGPGLAGNNTHETQPANQGGNDGNDNDLPDNQGQQVPPTAPQDNVNGQNNDDNINLNNNLKNPVNDPVQAPDINQPNNLNDDQMGTDQMNDQPLNQMNQHNQVGPETLNSSSQTGTRTNPQMG